MAGWDIPELVPSMGPRSFNRGNNETKRAADFDTHLTKPVEPALLKRELEMTERS